jgi:predicted glycoside hydrolase/deacetylase ChbG (UPF0249 family)
MNKQLHSRLRILRVVGLLLGGWTAWTSAADSDIQLLVRADDMGTAHAANEACIKAYRDGIARSVEVIVPGPWFLEAVQLLKENPGLDVGVHLALTSEWEGCKWGPLTHARSLMDEDGYFHPMTSQRKDFPPNTGFLEAKPNLGEVEAELRAQIEMAKRHIPRISHVSAHMGTPTATPQLRAITTKLAQEYKLRLENPGLTYASGFTGNTAAEKEASLADLIEKLKPGRWLLIEHPGFDTPEMRALGHLGYYSVAAERDAVTKAFTSELVKKVIQERGVRLISYGELRSQ